MLGAVGKLVNMMWPVVEEKTSITIDLTRQTGNNGAG